MINNQKGTNMKKGFTLTDLLAIVGIVLIIGLATFNIGKKYIFGNQQFIDLKYNFNTAYIKSNTGNGFDRVSIKGWKDWEKSDTIQVILKDGTPIYTHLSNIKLTKE